MNIILIKILTSTVFSTIFIVLYDIMFYNAHGYKDTSEYILICINLIIVAINIRYIFTTKNKPNK